MLKGILTFVLSPKESNQIFHIGGIEAVLNERGVFSLRDNQYVQFVSETGESLMIKRHSNTVFHNLSYPSTDNSKKKIKPMNDEQKCYFDLLHNSEIPIKVSVGMAGTGKTNLALKFGFMKMADKNSPIEKMILVRNPVECGEAVGFLKGDKNEKLGHWNNPAKDNYEDKNVPFEALVERGKIELDIPSLMLGRNLKNSWIIVDEAQHLNPQMFKMLGERVATGSEIIFIGDPSQDYGYTRGESGLEKAKKLIGNHLFGMVELKEDVRSEVSKLFATRY